ncbi:hypothetical protein ACFO5R_03880 [Halosolutus amylolyticus]|uniref:Uncharacterized protein n=1 Tax=Halosolutus amylolyticus TaxID=2932267 RepID=A0ABD5PKV7_9EURY|nr:hypothetical protein [Halosolutus amylolyticus]
MSEQQDRFNGDTRVLHRQAVRTPLPDADAERLFHRNMMAVADARERKADLLADPDVPLLAAYEAELDRIASTFERRLQRIAGDDYETAAIAYHRGERDDRIGALAAYYVEGLWRVQQRTTVTDMLYSPLILRYPDSFTVNIRFASAYATPESVLYESPEHSTDDLDDDHAETYYRESHYSQQQAAEYIRETAAIIREEFPHPDESSFDDRKYGGIVAAGGRRGSVFSDMLTDVEPDPDRFSEPISETTLVDEGPEAKRTENELFPHSDVVH